MEFVDRNEELTFLRARVPPACHASSLVILRSPPGFGKSTLTDRLLVELDRQSVNATLIDPSIRIRSGDARIYDGYFIQRCAADLALRADKNQIARFRDFLSARRWTTAGEKSPGDAIRRYPNFEGLYNTLVDYIERLMGTGSYGEDKILLSDSQYAVQICREYVYAVAASSPLVMVVREAQHIDHDSLRFFLIANKALADQHLILEYTSFNGRFDPDHEKVLLRELEGHRDASILDLLRLDQVHLQELLRKSIDADLDLSSEYYLHWDGNLRAISEMRYRVAVARRLDSAEQIKRSLSDFSGQLTEHLAMLTPLQKLALAVVAANVEAVDRYTLLSVLSRLDRLSTTSDREHALSDLVSKHKFLELSTEGMRFQNDDVAAAVNTGHSFLGLISMAQKGLRDFYRELIDGETFATVAAAAAMRQSLRLCALTNDTVGLLETAHRLRTIIRQTNDQMLYVDSITDALTSADLLGHEQLTLAEWAASLAYEVSDFSRTTAILSKLPQASLDAFQGVMLACSEQEIGKHDAALARAIWGRFIWQGTDSRLATQIVEFLVLRARNRIAEARQTLERMIRSPEFQHSPLLGYALRLFESVSDFPLATAEILRSVAEFEKQGLFRSQAYSELAAAVHMAREGRLHDAANLMAGATNKLQGEVRDHHLILNDRSVIELLGDVPDFHACIRDLTLAMQTSRDDFSDVTILNNLAIAYQMTGQLSEAGDCVEHILSILRDPSFGDRELLWGLAFTAMNVFTALGQTKRAQQVREMPWRETGSPLLNKAYWEVRFGQKSVAGEQFRFMLRHDYHPLFLSHWLIDLEGLEVLKRAPTRLLPDTTSPYS